MNIIYDLLSQVPPFLPWFLLAVLVAATISVAGNSIWGKHPNSTLALWLRGVAALMPPATVVYMVLGAGLMESKYLFPTVASIIATCGFMWAYSCANEGREFSEAKDKDSVTVGFLELYGALATVLVLVMAFV